MSELVPEYPLTGDLTIYQVAELKPRLENWLQQADPRLEIDLAGVENIDTAGLQLLALLKRESQAQGKSLCLRNHSPAVQHLFEKLNVAAFFGDPLVLSAQGDK